METGLIKRSAQGVAAAVISAVLLLPAANLCSFLCPDPDKYLGLLAIFALVATSVICGFIASGYEKNRIGAALIAGIVYSLILIALSAAVRGDEPLNAKCLLLLLSAGISALTAAAVNAAKNHTSRPSPDKLRRTIAAKYQH